MSKQSIWINEILSFGFIWDLFQENIGKYTLAVRFLYVSKPNPPFSLYPFGFSNHDFFSP